MYYDPDLGSYYEYNGETKTYTLHSRVQLPELQMRKRKKEREVEIILVDDDEFDGKELVCAIIPEGSSYTSRPPLSNLCVRRFSGGR